MGNGDSAKIRWGLIGPAVALALAVAAGISAWGQLQEKTSGLSIRVGTVETEMKSVIRSDQYRVDQGEMKRAIEGLTLSQAEIQKSVVRLEEQMRILPQAIGNEVVTQIERQNRRRSVSP